jgi:Zn-finger nucleic acid-binding protein
MHCPTCQSPLKPTRRETIELDVCGKCGGLWFDSGEVEAYRAAAPPDSYLPPPPAVFGPFARSRGARCPRCEGDFLVEGRAAGVRLFRCSQGCGFFVPSLKPSMPDYTRGPQAGAGVIASDSLFALLSALRKILAVLALVQFPLLTVQLLAAA